MDGFADRIRELRKEKGMSQSDLARALGIPRVTVSSWENNNRTPELIKIKTLSDYFSVSTDYLLANTDIKNPSAVKQNAEELYNILKSAPNDLVETIKNISTNKDLQLLFQLANGMNPASLSNLIRIAKALKDDI